MASSDEREIRDAVVARLRELLPSARIVHELNIAGQGSNRIDVAAVTRNAIVAAEIKSKKDKLDRLDTQWPAFLKVSDYLIVAAHEKHFVRHRDKWEREDSPGELRLNHVLFLNSWSRRKYVWPYPRPAEERGAWTFDPIRDIQMRFPLNAGDMLNMLWADELSAECSRHRVAAGARPTRFTMIRQMASMMTGREVREAVCRQLRQRSFAEADEPIRDDPRPDSQAVMPMGATV